MTTPTPQVSDLPLLPPGMYTPGVDPTLHADELIHLIRAHIDRHPRGLQKALGPSDLGTPCTRRLGYALAGVEPVNPRGGAWRPTIGTAVHAWLEGALTAHNDAHTVDRFYLEERVHVGDVGGVPITGSCDVYDRILATVVDWKVVGVTALKRYRKAGSPGDAYRRQVHLYGRGFRNAGLPVDHVSVLFLPNNGELSDAYHWTEPYDEALALDTLTRANGVASAVAAAGTAVLPLLPTANAHCTYCPAFCADSTDLAVGCPGDPGRPVRADSTLSLIA